MILVFGVSLLLGLMFVAGNYQNFADSTQLQLLRVLQGLSGSVALGGLIVAGLVAFDALRYKMARLLIRSGVYVLVSIIAFGLAVGSSSLLVLFRPL